VQKFISVISALKRIYAKVRQNKNTEYFSSFYVCQTQNSKNHSLRALINFDIDIRGAAERTPLFGKLINSKPKKIWQMFFFYFWKVHRMPFYISVFWTKHHSSGGLEYWYTDVASLSVIVHDLENHFRCNGSNFLSYRLLRSFQSLGTLFVNLCLEVAPEKKIAGGQIWQTRRPHGITTQGDNCYRRPAIFYKLLNNKGSMFSPDHAMAYTENGTYTAVRWRAPHHCTRSPPEAMPLPNRGILSATPCKMGSYTTWHFCAQHVTGRF